MGVFEKLKNVFFEEEYVEVEEPIRKKTPKEPVVAKKVELPEIKKKKEEVVVEQVEDERKEPEEDLAKEGINHNNRFKFPMDFEEDDFKNDDVPVEKPPKKEVISEIKEEPKSYNSTFSGLYEGNLESKKKKEFKPTPIISPIYGILDKNYKKDEIVTKKEIRISSRPKNVDLDTVREKAYGDLASDITASMYENTEENNDEGDDNNLLYDLNESDSPAVRKVTVGDAEEYYNDLGLEYNVDYKDNAKEKATGRRVKPESKEEKNNDEVEDQATKDQKEESAIEDNLFDLIDSMYEDKE